MLALLRQAERAPVARPVDPKKLARKYLYKAKRRSGKRTMAAVVSVPEREEQPARTSEIEAEGEAGATAELRSRRARKIIPLAEKKVG